MPRYNVLEFSRFTNPWAIVKESMSKLVAIVVVAVACSVTLNVMAAILLAPRSPGDAVPAEFFSMGMNGTYPTQPIGLLGKKPGTTWAWLETGRGVYDWKPMDKYVDLAAAHGVKGIWTLDGTPKWAGPSRTLPPTNLHDLTEFSKAMALRYKGKIKYYEYMNEPNLDSEWTGTYAQAVAMAGAFYRGIKVGDPAALVGGPGLAVNGYHRPNAPTASVMTDWLGGFLEAGGAQYSDFASYHAFACNEGQYGCQHGFGCKFPDVLGCAGLPLKKQFKAFQAVMDANGMSGKPVIISEGGWGPDRNITLAGSTIATVEAQGEYVERWFRTLASENPNGLAMVSWYMWSGGKWGTLYDENNSQHPVALRFARVQHDLAEGK
jgi:hypothetical protein